MGAAGIELTSSREEFLVPSTDLFLPRPIKSVRTLISSFSFSFPWIGDVGSGSILFKSVDEGGSVCHIPGDECGMRILWSVGVTDGAMSHSQLA